MSLPYTKMSGAGNTFIVIEERFLPEGTDPGPLAPTLCADQQEHGGADGLIVISRDGGGNRFEMKYYNRDGSTGMMCGNGGRCAVRFAFEHGYVEEMAGIDFTNAGVAYEAKLESRGRLGERADSPNGSADIAPFDPDHATIWFPDPSGFEVGIELELPDRELHCHFIDVGTPHVVTFVDEMREPSIAHVDDVDVARLGKMIRYHERFAPDGTNANFVEILETDRSAEQSGDEGRVRHAIRVRTYERGVEAETGACGTGATASAIVTALVRKIDPPFDVITTSGALLEVDFAIERGRVSSVSLGGQAVVLSTGEFGLAW